MTRITWGKSLVIAAIISLLALLPLIARGEYMVNILCVVYLYITLSQSWNILGGYAGQINVGQSAFFGIGALTARLLWIQGIPFYVALLAGGMSSVILAAIIGSPALRLRGHYFAIGTLALAWIAHITIGNILPGVSFLPAKYIATYSLIPRYYASLAILVGTTAVIYLIVVTRLGLAMEAVRDDEEAAQAAGVNTFKCKFEAFIISSFFAGLAGGSFSFYHVSYYWYIPFGLMWCFEPILITFIGGIGTLTGPIIGSICYVAFKELFALTMGEVNVLIFGAVFILVILFLPGGIVGLPEKLREVLSKWKGGGLWRNKIGVSN